MPEYWGDPYGIPVGPWDTFGGPAPVPAMEWRVTSTAPEGWPREWITVADARTLRNLLDFRDEGTNYHGIEVRVVESSGQLAMEIAA